MALLSWEAWANVPSVSTQVRRILGKGTGTELFSLSIAANETKPTVAWSLAGSGRQTAVLNSVVVGAGWIHLVFTYDGATWRAFVNGVEDRSGSVTGALVTSVDPIVLGSRADADEWFDARLADVAVYPYALAANQIANHFAQRTEAAIGTGQLAYTVAANSTGAPRTGSLAIAGRSVPVAQAAVNGVVIAAHASPDANAAGWNTSDVTISFVCAGDGVVTCADPVTVEQDGVQEVSGSASNDLGASATAWMTVRVDRTAPLLSIESPTISSIVSAGPLTVTGTAADSLSAASVTCNGQPATISEFAFTCDVVAPTGPSTILVRAVDQAANVREVVVDIDTSDLQARPPSSLRVTPQAVTMRIGEKRRFSPMDDLGRIPSNAVWTVDDLNIVSIVTTPQLEVTAVAAGEVTLTATWQGLTATTQVTVSPLETLPVGTTTWSNPPIHGAVTKIVQGTVSPDGSRLTFVLESTGDSGSDDVIRVFDEDGAERWSTRVPAGATNLSGDAMGGLLVSLAPAAGTGADHTLRRFAAGGAPNDAVAGLRSGSYAVHPDGPVYAVVGNQLVGLDVGMGAGRSAALPAHSRRGHADDYE